VRALGALVRLRLDSAKRSRSNQPHTANRGPKAVRGRSEMRIALLS